MVIDLATLLNFSNDVVFAARAPSIGGWLAGGAPPCSCPPLRYLPPQIYLALLALGVKHGDKVITNGFTFTALPSCIMRIGAEPVLVEPTEQYTMDLDDLEKKAQESDAKVLLLSHMRGKVCDMDRVVEICEKYGLTLVEDCAHGCGVMWKGRQLGYHAAVACYSTQSDKVGR